eukprot:gene2958-284_t
MCILTESRQVSGHGSRCNCTKGTVLITIHQHAKLLITHTRLQMWLAFSMWRTIWQSHLPICCSVPGGPDAFLTLSKVCNQMYLHGDVEYDDVASTLSGGDVICLSFLAGYQYQEEEHDQILKTSLGASNATEGSRVHQVYKLVDLVLKKRRKLTIDHSVYEGNIAAAFPVQACKGILMANKSESFWYSKDDTFSKSFDIPKESWLAANECFFKLIDSNGQKGYHAKFENFSHRGELWIPLWLGYDGCQDVQQLMRMSDVRMSMLRELGMIYMSPSRPRSQTSTKAPRRKPLPSSVTVELWFKRNHALLLLKWRDARGNLIKVSATYAAQFPEEAPTEWTDRTVDAYQKSQKLRSSPLDRINTK